MQSQAWTNLYIDLCENYVLNQDIENVLWTMVL